MSKILIWSGVWGAAFILLITQVSFQEVTFIGIAQSASKIGIGSAQQRPVLIAEGNRCQALKERMADTKSPMMLERLAEEYSALCSSRNELKTPSPPPNQTSGDNGQLYSAGSEDFYLLSRQRYATEDSSGYEGRLRVVKKYEGGGYEEKRMEYTARCNAPFDQMIYVMVRRAGTEEYGDRVDIKSPDKFPGAEKKSAYNLYWAVCRQQFRKFK